MVAKLVVKYTEVSAKKNGSNIPNTISPQPTPDSKPCQFPSIANGSTQKTLQLFSSQTLRILDPDRLQPVSVAVECRLAAEDNDELCSSSTVSRCQSLLARLPTEVSFLSVTPSHGLLVTNVTTAAPPAGPLLSMFKINFVRGLLSVGHCVRLPPEALGVQRAVVADLLDFG